MRRTCCKHWTRAFVRHRQWSGRGMVTGLPGIRFRDLLQTVSAPWVAPGSRCDETCAYMYRFTGVMLKAPGLRRVISSTTFDRTEFNSQLCIAPCCYAIWCHTAWPQILTHFLNGTDNDRWRARHYSSGLAHKTRIGIAVNVRVFHSQILMRWGCVFGVIVSRDVFFCLRSSRDCVLTAWCAKYRPRGRAERKRRGVGLSQATVCVCTFRCGVEHGYILTIKLSGHT
jgi:hypothetical protein